MAMNRPHGYCTSARYSNKR